MAGLPMAQSQQDANPETVPPLEGEDLIQITPLALAKARKFLAEEQDPGTKVLRVGVDSGGCSGFSYKVEIGVEKQGDHVQVYPDGFKLVVDPVGLTFIKGSTLDYVDAVGEANFKFINPQATDTCGCGISFSV